MTGETKHLLKSGMDIFYLMRKKDVRVFNGVFPFYFVFLIQANY